MRGKLGEAAGEDQEDNEHGILGREAGAEGVEAYLRDGTDERNNPTRAASLTRGFLFPRSCFLESSPAVPCSCGLF